MSVTAGRGRVEAGGVHAANTANAANKAIPIDRAAQPLAPRIGAW